jgi:hypothetical protein
MADGTLMDVLMSQPIPLRIWLTWLGAMNLIMPLAFIRNIEARIILIAFVVNALVMNLLYAWMGYGPHLGLAHVIFWTPLLPWLTTRLESIAARSRPFLVYVFALLVTNGISLGIDFVDVIFAADALMTRGT